MKYESMLTKQEPTDWGSTRHFWLNSRRGDVRLPDQQYWHSMLNDGTETLENWPYYREYMVYKSWFEEVEDKALNTLKGAVAKLLSDFDDQENSKYYDGGDLTKRGQF